MMKLKKGIVILLSASVVVLLFLALQELVTPKYTDIVEGNFTAEYYDETTDHDVVLVGDCEVYENINPMYLWKNYGITSYIRGNAQQLTWQSYYMLEDILKYETPKVVIYNVQALTHDSPQREEYNRMTLDGMKWSTTKWNAIKTSMCDGEKMLEYAFPLLRYHSRILELSEDDFTSYGKREKTTHNGYYLRVDVLPVSESNVADTAWLFGEEDTTEEIVDPWATIETEEEIGDAKLPLSGGEEDRTFGAMPMEYLDKIRILCEENGISLILMKAPSLAPQWYEEENQQVVEYAQKHNLLYVNFYELIEELGIDYETDTYDGGLHMNLSGADKMSEYLGKLLLEEYDIQDHREDQELASVYNEKYDYFEKMKQKQLDDIEKYGEIQK